MIGPDLDEVFAYIPKVLKNRVKAVCEKQKGLSISKVTGGSLAACIEAWEEQVGIKPAPKQGTRIKRKLDA